MSQYFTKPEIERIVAETEAELIAREAKAEAEARLARMQAWIADPANKDVVDSHPMVQAIRRAPARPGGWYNDAPQPSQRTAPVPTAAPAPTGYKSREQLEREKPWLAPRKTELQSVIDPYAGRKPNRI
jgi:hypothetical protein